MTFTDVSARHLFPTPFIAASLAPGESAAINAALIPMLLQKAEASGLREGGYRGWQSDDGLVDWGGEPVHKILTALGELLKQITLHMEGTTFKRTYTEWRINGWANISRKGHMMPPHAHPGAYWSAVYYVQTDDEPDGQPKGGELELLDPRGIVPILSNPRLRWGVQGYTSAGGSELYKPKAGQCVVFPAWLTHAVRPYIGDGTRISLGFNFTTY